MTAGNFNEDLAFSAGERIELVIVLIEIRAGDELADKAARDCRGDESISSCNDAYGPKELVWRGVL